MRVLLLGGRAAGRAASSRRRSGCRGGAGAGRSASCDERALVAAAVEPDAVARARRSGRCSGASARARRRGRSRFSPSRFARPDERHAVGHDERRAAQRGTHLGIVVSRPSGRARRRRTRSRARASRPCASIASIAVRVVGESRPARRGCRGWALRGPRRGRWPRHALWLRRRAAGQPGGRGSCSPPETRVSWPTEVRGGRRGPAGRVRRRAPAGRAGHGLLVLLAIVTLLARRLVGGRARCLWAGGVARRLPAGAAQQRGRARRCGRWRAPWSPEERSARCSPPRRRSTPWSGWPQGC